MPKQTATLRERIHYSVDNYLARGISSLFLFLLIFFLVGFSFIVLWRLAMHLIGPDPKADMMAQTWRVYLQLTDPGNMNQDNTSPSYFKAPAILAGLTGVVIFSTLIATLTAALDQAIAALKRGHSRVLEESHTLILGWTTRVPEILRELVEANESETNPSVVILSQRDKEWMDEYLRVNFRDRRNLKVITRHGMPADPASLKHVSVAESKSVIILASCDENASKQEQLSSDAKGIKTMLALEAAAPGAEFPIVIEIYNSRNREVVSSVAPERANMVDAEEILAKVMVQTSRTSGLSVVYSELLSFDGCEMYFYDADWNGITFGACQFHFPDGVPIGIRTPDGTVTLRPPLDHVLEDGQEVLIVAEDDSTIEFRTAPVAQPRDLPLKLWRLEPQKEHLLILGWSPKASIVISEYGEYVAAGSSVTVVLNDPTEEVITEVNAAIAESDEVKIELKNLNAFDFQELSALKPFDYNDIMILPQKLSDDPDSETIDTETIVLLLLLRGMKNRLIQEGVEVTTKIVTEVLESKNHSLVHQAGVNDFIISNRMVSMIFAQVSEEPRIKLVYDDLFQEDGSEIYVKPAELYFESLPVEVTFADLMLLAQKRDEEACIGIKHGSLSNDAEQNYGVKLIPPKEQTFKIDAGDCLVVVAEDER